MILEEAGYIKTGRMSTHIFKKEFTEARVADIMIEKNRDWRRTGDIVGRVEYIGQVRR